jgi:hypothetical protein
VTVLQRRAGGSAAGAARDRRGRRHARRHLAPGRANAPGDAGAGPAALRGTARLRQPGGRDVWSGLHAARRTARDLPEERHRPGSRQWRWDLAVAHPGPLHNRSPGNHPRRRRGSRLHAPAGAGGDGGSASRIGPQEGAMTTVPERLDRRSRRARCLTLTSPKRGS